MSDIILYDYWRSSASYRVRIVLNLKGVAYTVCTHQASSMAHHKAPDYVARNPQGFVPMLSIDGHDLTQSLAIIDYLDAQYHDPKMVSPEPATRARTLAQAVADRGRHSPRQQSARAQISEGKIRSGAGGNRRLVPPLDRRRLHRARGDGTRRRSVRQRSAQPRRCLPRPANGQRTAIRYCRCRRFRRLVRIDAVR